MQLSRSAYVLLPAQQVFDLIEHAEHYPEFLPWCLEASILERHEHFVRARVGFGYAALHSHFHAHVDKRPPTGMDVHIEGWPFELFKGEWQIQPIGDKGCRTTFTVRCDIQDPLWDQVLSLAAGFIADKLVDAFMQRARRIAAEQALKASSAA